MTVRQPNQRTLWALTLALLLILVVLAAGLWWASHQPVPAQNSAATAQEEGICFGGIPRATDAAAAFTLLTNRAYVAGYSEARHDPLFTAYHLKGLPSMKTDKRPGSFSEDQRTAAKIVSDDYKGSGFDRGHMTPNHVIDVYFGVDAQKETFLMSNVVPQLHTLNAGVWEKIEAHEANELEPKFGEMWVIIGPIFGQKPATIGNGVQVPAACFRIWVRREGGVAHAQAFICPNEGPTGKELPAGYVRTVKEVEGQTGLSFFEEEQAAEKARLELEKVGMW